MENITLNDFSTLNSRNEIHNLLSKSKVQRICEVGVDYGFNLTNLCKCKPKLAVAIDIWDITPYYEFYSVEFHERNYREILRRRLQENECILPIRLDSLKAVQIFPDEFFDFIYIDASHDYESVKKNIEAYWPKLAKGRFMAGHDYKDGPKTIPAKNLRIEGPPVMLDFGVKRAVDEFAANVGSGVAVLKDENGIDSWAIEKK